MLSPLFYAALLILEGFQLCSKCKRALEMSLYAATDRCGTLPLRTTCYKYVFRDDFPAWSLIAGGVQGPFLRLVRTSKRWFELQTAVVTYETEGFKDSNGEEQPPRQVELAAMVSSNNLCPAKNPRAATARYWAR